LNLDQLRRLALQSPEQLDHVPSCLRVPGQRAQQLGLHLEDAGAELEDCLRRRGRIRLLRGAHALVGPGRFTWDPGNYLLAD